MSERFSAHSAIDTLVGAVGAAAGIAAAVEFDIYNKGLQHEYPTAVSAIAGDSASAQALQHFGATHPDLSSKDKSSLAQDVSHYKQLQASVTVPEKPTPTIQEGIADAGFMIIGAVVLNYVSRGIRFGAFNVRRRHKAPTNTSTLAESP